MKKKMLTFLGTSLYEETFYTYGRKKPCKTPFVQTSLIRFFGPFDQAVIFLTESAKSANWRKLSKAAKEQCPECELVPVDIKDGKNQDEMWETFETLLSCIDQDDEVVFDITHSFRSIPVLSLACVQYLRSLKNVELSGIYYGAWEAKTEREDGETEAPIFDLTPFVELMDWSRSVSDFVNYGETGPLTDLTKKESGRLTKKLKGNLKTFADSLRKLQNEISTCRGLSIYEGRRLGQIEPNMKKLEKNAAELPPPFLPLMQKLKNRIEVLKGWPGLKLDQEILRGFGAVEWCLEHGLTQQAYTLLQENLITFFCKTAGLDWRCKDPDRMVAGLSAAVFRKDPVEWKGLADTRRDLVAKIHGSVDGELLSLFEDLSQFRNDINHGGMVYQTNPGTFKKKIEICFENIKKWFEEASQ